MAETRRPLRYVAVDISPSAAERTGNAVYSRCQDLEVEIEAVVADFQHDLGFIRPSGRRIVALFGGTFGNLFPFERARLLTDLRSALNDGDTLLLGVDTVRSKQVLSAYDDSDGITAKFNLNLLRVLNRSFGGDFDSKKFKHVAVWDAEQNWVEMRLRSLVQQRVRLQALDFETSFGAGEEMRTEISARFQRADLEDELAKAGFSPQTCWTDSSRRYALSLSLVG